MSRTVLHSPSPGSRSAPCGRHQYAIPTYHLQEIVPHTFVSAKSLGMGTKPDTKTLNPKNPSPNPEYPKTPNISRVTNLGTRIYFCLFGFRIPHDFGR